MAGLIRAQCRAQVIGVTGSGGKTTTKDMIAHLLRMRYPMTLKTYRNYNGMIGVPLTLRKLTPEHDFAVLEIGMGEEGSVGRGAALAKPHVGVVTGIGNSHLSKFGSLERIALEKEALLHSLQPGGLAVLNSDDPFCRQMATRFADRVTLFGRAPDSDLQIRESTQMSWRELSVAMAHNGREWRFSLPVIGEFQAYNAAAAMAVGLEAGLHMDEMTDRMSSFRPGQQRLKPERWSDILLVDDGYNASPAGVLLSVKAFQALPWEGPRVAILGDIQDQGTEDDIYYTQLAADLLQSSLDSLVLIGHSISGIAPSLPNAVVAGTPKEAAALAMDILQGKGSILIKGTEDKLLAIVRDELRTMLKGGPFYDLQAYRSGY
jgi:UDP-N-acetylmuramoyl-tripeptide--D-alanyl-D-alanine ligase